MSDLVQKLDIIAGWAQAMAPLESDPDEKQWMEMIEAICGQAADYIKDLEHRLTAKPVQPDAFDAFWAAYPRHIGKDAARKAWLKAVKRADPAAIIAAAKEFAAAPICQGDRQYIKHPGTWLSAGCWEDDRAEWQVGTGTKSAATDESKWVGL